MAPVQSGATVIGSAAQAPLLIGAAVATPELEPGPVGGAGAAGVQAQPRLGADDGAVGGDVPLLVGLAIAVPDDDSRAAAGALAIGVQAPVAVQGELPVGGVGPALVGAAVAVPKLRLGAVGGAAGHVDAAAGAGTHDRHTRLTRRWAARRLAARRGRVR